MIANSALDLIGNTPIVKINKLNTNKNVEIYAKLEGQSIGGSVKDRIALNMIEQAEKSGELNKSKTIIEPTSGNTGIGVALVGAAKGYKVTIVMSAGMSQERKKVIRALGAKLIETPADKKTDGAIEKAHELVKKYPNKYWMPDQFSNKNNPLAHYKTTAKEIIKQVPDVTAFVAGMGTSGTLMGTSMRLKEYNKNIQIIGLEPVKDHKIAALKNMCESAVPEIYDQRRLDKIIKVYTKESYNTARLLAKKEGLLVGMSAGAAMAGALKYAKTIKKGKIVVLFPDRAERYLSTELF